MKTTPLFPIGTAMQQTGLTARQIRYYEENGLIQPARTEGKHRLYSFQDLEKLEEIIKLIDEGISIAGIKKKFLEKEWISPEKSDKEKISESEIRKLLRNEFKDAGRFNSGKNTNFFKN